MSLPFLYLLPVGFVVVWIALLVSGRRRGLVVSALMCAVTFAVGAWSIRQSRSSTAAIGFLFLPGAAALSGALALAFGRLQADSRAAMRFLAWTSLAAALAVGVAMAASGVRQQQKNHQRDREAEEARYRIDENRRTIADLISRGGDGAGLALEAQIVQHLNDRTFLVPALETSVVSADTLDRFGTHADLGVALTVARNPHTRAATLDRIYRTSTYPFYFFLALAENPNTPVAILRELAAHPEPIDQSAMRRALARNPSTPADLLSALSEFAERR